jgi:hypothetical protein
VIPLEEQATFDASTSAYVGVIFAALIAAGAAFIVIVKYVKTYNAVLVTAVVASAIACAAVAVWEFVLRRLREKSSSRDRYPTSLSQPPASVTVQEAERILDYAGTLPRYVPGKVHRLRGPRPQIPFVAQVAMGFVLALGGMAFSCSGAGPIPMVVLLIGALAALVSKESRGFAAGILIPTVLATMAVLAICGSMARF